MQKLVITVAVTGHRLDRATNPNVPITPEEISDTAQRCEEIGASVIHIHARDAEGKSSIDPAIFERTHRLVSTRTNLIVQISTGAMAKALDVEARTAAVRQIQPEMASLNCGSTDFGGIVFQNPPYVVEAIAKALLHTGTKPEMEVFEAGMIANALALMEKGLAKTPLHFGFVLGVSGAMPASPKNLLFLAESIPQGATWSVAALGRWQLPMTAMALVMGGHVRVGLEDNTYLCKGKLASNEQLVSRVVRLANELQRPVATPDEARAILGLPVRNQTSGRNVVG